MSDDPIYDDWIVNRRSVKPTADLSQRVMAAVEERDQHRRIICLPDRMNDSMVLRWAACASAMLVGMLPILYAAYVAKLIVL